PAGALFTANGRVARTCRPASGAPMGHRGRGVLVQPVPHSLPAPRSGRRPASGDRSRRGRAAVGIDARRVAALPGRGLRFPSRIRTALLAAADNRGRPGHPRATAPGDGSPADRPGFGTTHVNRRRRVLLGCAIAGFFVYVVSRGAQRGNDFKYPYGAAQALWRTSPLRVAAQPRYPISFHVLLSPLASLPILLASAVWAALSFAAVALLPRLLEEHSGLSPRRQLWCWMVVAP